MAAIKEKIVAEAESLTESVAWKVTTARLKTLLEDWKKAPRLDKKWMPHFGSGFLHLGISLIREGVHTLQT